MDIYSLHRRSRSAGLVLTAFAVLGVPGSMLEPRRGPKSPASYGPKIIRSSSIWRSSGPIRSLQGNQTFIMGPSGDSIALQRLSNCSLTLYGGTLTYGSTPSLENEATTANYQNVLHAEAGLATTANAFSNGCAEAPLGAGSRRAVNLGVNAQSQYLLASTGYSSFTGSNGLFYGTADQATMTVFPFHTDSSLPSMGSIAAGVNGDGTLNAPQSFAVPTPSTSPGRFPLVTLIAAKLRAAGYMDLVGSNGLVLLNNGSGSFTVGTSAFTPSDATSDYGPNLTAADINHDGVQGRWALRRSGESSAGCQVFRIVTAVSTAQNAQG
jgi:hypothetical protein